MIKALYQPSSVEPINEKSIIIRNCLDRLTSMLEFCQERYGESFADKTYLDIGSCYGYFLNGFKDHCNDVVGIENGKNQMKMCQIFYPEISGKVIQKDFTKEEIFGQYDIVSFLSVIHSIIISDGLEYATTLLQSIDEKTKDILFFDMGQEAEQEYEINLSGWNPESISKWILESTTFDVCEPLMEDKDHHMGRTLFVCYRNIKK
jgi:hypothetical protein